jgi:hypothetical protein
VWVIADTLYDFALICYGASIAWIRANLVRLTICPCNPNFSLCILLGVWIWLRRKRPIFLTGRILFFGVVVFMRVLFLVLLGGNRRSRT